MTNDYIERFKQKIAKRLNRKTNITNVTFEKDVSSKLGLRYLFVTVYTRYGGHRRFSMMLSKEMELSEDMEEYNLLSLMSNIENFIYQDSRLFLKKKKKDNI